MPETLNNRLLAIEKRLDDLMASLTCEELAFTVFPQPIGQSQTWHPALDSMSVTEARDYIEQGQFPKGSTLPKVEAAIKFVESKNERRSFHRLNAQKKPLKEKQGQLFIKIEKVC